MPFLISVVVGCRPSIIQILSISSKNSSSVKFRFSFIGISACNKISFQLPIYRTTAELEYFPYFVYSRAVIVGLLYRAATRFTSSITSSLDIVKRLLLPFVFNSANSSAFFHEPNRCIIVDAWYFPFWLYSTPVRVSFCSLIAVSFISRTNSSSEIFL